MIRGKIEQGEKDVGGYILNRVIRVGLNEKVMFEL